MLIQVLVAGSNMRWELSVRIKTWLDAPAGPTPRPMFVASEPTAVQRLFPVASCVLLIACPRPSSPGCAAQPPPVGAPQSRLAARLLKMLLCAQVEPNVTPPFVLQYRIAVA